MAPVEFTASLAFRIIRMKTHFTYLISFMLLGLLVACQPKPKDGRTDTFNTGSVYITADESFRPIIQEEIDADKGLAYICSRIPEFDAVVISDIPAQLRNDIIKYCYKIGKRTYVTPKISDIIVGGAEDIHLFDTPLYLIRARGLNFEERFFKRTMDIVCCLLALAVCWPFMIAIAIAIKAEDRGPVFYKQRRCTRDNKEFNILNLRCMEVVRRLHNIMAYHSIISCSKSTILSRFSVFRHSSGGASCLLTA